MGGLYGEHSLQTFGSLQRGTAPLISRARLWSHSDYNWQVAPCTGLGWCLGQSWCWYGCAPGFPLLPSLPFKYIPSPDLGNTFLTSSHESSRMVVLGLISTVFPPPIYSVHLFIQATLGGAKGMRKKVSKLYR